MTNEQKNQCHAIIHSEMLGNKNSERENAMNEKKMIIDLVNKIKYEVTAEQLAELAGCATPLSKVEFVDWEARIDALDLTDGGRSVFRSEIAAQLRALLHRILKETRKIGGKVIPLGKRIIRWIFSLLERYPNTVTAALIMAALCYLVAQIPLVRVILLPIAQTVAAGVIGFVFAVESVRVLVATHGGNR